MTADGYRAFGVAPCVICGKRFVFDPDRVPVVLVDPQTGRPPDVDSHGNRQEADPAAVERAETRPYCPNCARRLNIAAGQRGLPAHFDETDTFPLGKDGLPYVPRH